MPLELNRAQRHYLGLSVPFSSSLDEETELLTGVKPHAEASATLLDLLYAPGTLRGGPLFGHRLNGTLHVRLAAPAGYAW